MRALNHDEIVEQGIHEALLAKRGVYFDLYDSQFAEPLLEAGYAPSGWRPGRRGRRRGRPRHDRLAASYGAV